MTNKEKDSLGINQAMKVILGQAAEDDHALICKNLAEIRVAIRKSKLPEEKLKTIKFLANEMISDIQKELMSAPADSRIHDISPRSREERTPDPANREES